MRLGRIERNPQISWALAVDLKSCANKRVVSVYCFEGLGKTKPVSLPERSWIARGKVQQLIEVEHERN